MSQLPDLIVECVRDGKRAAVRVPYRVVDGNIVIDSLTASGAGYLVNTAAWPEKLNQPSLPPNYPRRRFKGRPPQ